MTKDAADVTGATLVVDGGRLLVDGEPLRVVQWTIGNVARQSLRALVERPDLDLVGLFAHSLDKVGRDAGDLAGLGRSLGISATNDIDAVLALEPDCVAYMPLYPDVDHLCRLLAAGVNVVTTSEFLTGRSYGEQARSRLEAAAQEGGASLFGSGVNPGWVEYVAAIASGVCRDVSCIRVVESFNLAFLAGDANQDDFGWGRPPGDPGHADDVRQAVAEFGDAAELLAQLLGVTLDDVRCEVEFAHAITDLDLPGRPVKQGHVAGIDVTWHGVVSGHSVLELNARWTLTQQLEPAWDVLMGYLIEVRGDPHVNVRIDFMPRDLATATLDDLVVMGAVLTAMPAVNAIPAVVAARPGIVTYRDLPPMTGRVSTS